MTKYLPRLSSLPWLPPLLNERELAGTALGLLDDHLETADPHSQYALRGGYTPSSVLIVGEDGHIISSSITSGTLQYLANLTGNVQSQLNGKAPTSHTHGIDAINELQETLENKADLIGGVVPSSQLPARVMTDVYTVSSAVDMVALDAEEGDVAIRTDVSKTYIHNGGTSGTAADWSELVSPTDAVTSVNGLIGNVTLGYDDVGAAAAVHGHAIADVSGLQTAIDGKALTSRLITAGTGLTGGGDLSADRTIAVIYGTSAGTSCQGNDTRLGNSRTPTAHASSHGSGGSDPITIATSQIANYGVGYAVLSGNNSYTGTQYVAGIVAVNGAYIGTNNYTASTQKTAGFFVPHYAASTATGTNCIGFLLAAQASANVALFGGGTSGGYAATHLRFFAASNTTTPTGTVVAEFTYNGATFNIPVIISGDTLRIVTTKTPVNSSTSGTAGDLCTDGDYLYRCSGGTGWKRIAWSTY